MEMQTQRAMTAVDRMLYSGEKDKEVSDLHTVDENADDEPLESKQEVRDFVLTEIMQEFLQKETFKIARSQVKVFNFVRMCLWRMRFKKKQMAVVRM